MKKHLGSDAKAVLEAYFESGIGYQSLFNQKHIEVIFSGHCLFTKVYFI